MNELQKKEADKQRMIAEVNLLKSQIQPHFLFNTLNNLYGLALSSSDLTADCVMRLSKIMEYMLYKSEMELVPIGLEIQYFRNYIELEKLRYGKRLQVSWDIDESFFVSVSKIKVYTGEDVEMYDRKLIPVGEPYRKAFREVLQKHSL